MIELLGPASIIALIFGGCCSNVFALEAIVKQEPDSGLLITFLQFALATFFSSPTQLSRPASNKKDAKPPVPLWRWSVIAAMFFAVNMLNNWAFAFNISVPVHIILRSFGSVWTMMAGWLRGKAYSALQIFSVALLTVGVLVSAWADAKSKGKNLSASSQTDTSSFLSGLAILLAAQILSAYMGIYVQDTYATYTTNWQENLFWSHFLSLPLFLPFAPTLKRQYASLARTQPLSSTLDINRIPLLTALPPLLQQQLSRLSTAPSGLVFLSINALTQLACISGVNLLAAYTSAVTVTIVLNVRKLVSFVFSTWLFGHTLSTEMALGAGLVFGSGALYGWESSWRIPRARAAGEKREQGEGKGMNGHGKAQ